MINNVLILLGILFASIHCFAKRKECSAIRVVDIYFVYFLFFSVGMIGLLGFISHVFFPVQTAKLIGWSNSPFQFEVGFQDGAWGLLGILAIWVRGKFWLATAIGWSFFLLGAAYNHIVDVIVSGNYAPYNAGIILPDIVVPVVLLLLAYFKFVRFAKSQN